MDDEDGMGWCKGFRTKARKSYRTLNFPLAASWYLKSNGGWEEPCR